MLGPTPCRFVVGTMTGTSIDGLDAALARIEGRGLKMRCLVESHREFRFPPALARRLRAAAEQAPMTSGDLARLAHEFGQFHADCLEEFLTGRVVDLAVLHGQTVFHAPPCSWQLIQPAAVAERLGIPVLSDLRQADLAAGGQGAPITPLADWVLFRGDDDRVIVNLGGFCNATLLPGGGGPETVRGFDVCACNQLLDAVARLVLAAPFDRDGHVAASGRPDPRAAEGLTEVLLRQRAAGRSLGTGDEGGAWIASARDMLSPADLAATAAAAVGRAIGTVIREAGIGPGATAFWAGGGSRHRPLTEAIAAAAGCSARPLKELGVGIEVREALCMAVLGALAEDGLSVTLPAVTGRSMKRAGDGLWSLPSGPRLERARPGQPPAPRS